MNTIANANLFSRLFDRLDDPNRLAIETLDGQRVSYGELVARTGQMANVLVSRGLKPGDRAAAQGEKSVSGLVLYLATVRVIRSQPASNWHPSFGISWGSQT
jgi:malonyl-CoA/methylmalonyl-CoA synthetase